MTQKGGQREEEEKEKAYALTYIAFGAGVQSTALLVMSASGDIPRADVAIFADTGDEPQYVYDQVERMRVWSSIPVVTVTAGHLGGRLLARARGEIQSASSIPMWVKGETGKPTPLGRHCTRDHKLVPIKRYVRSRLADGGVAVGLIGISWDERTRMKDSDVSYVRLAYPLVDAHVTRDACLSYLKERGLPLPERSACRYCPWHRNGYWRFLRDDHPAEFEKACVFDEAARDLTNNGVREPAFLHRSLVPLRVADLEPEPTMFDDLSEVECEGMCGV